ncbi:MAG: autotransporter-associated beta strand repeat-containing protein [Verrucomicrobia bacterium]|nr:autotransporter-associated beta strand repeat-containing protein [Verrucomicrobiota bacterium]
MNPRNFRISAVTGSSPLFAILIAAAGAPSLLADEYTWTQNSAATQDWTASANWDATGVFVGGNANNLALFADTTTALASGNNLITTNVPATLTLRALTLRGLGSDSGGPAGITLGTSASTWTMDRSDTGNALINLDAMAGAQGLNYTIASNITLTNDSLTVLGNGTAAFDFTGTLTRAGRAFRKEGNSTATFSGTITGSTDFEVYGGTLNITGNLHTSATAGKITARGDALYGSSATLNLSGTVFAGSAGLGVEGTNSQLNITGGTTTVNGNAVFIAPATSKTGTMSVSGGTLAVATGKHLWIGADGYNGNTVFGGNGVLTISGTGSVDTGTSNTGTFRVGSNLASSTGTGTLNLDGGTLALNRAITFGSKTNSGTFNFNGGTLKALGTSATLTATTTGRANVRNSGAIIDTNGFAVTLGEELQHSNIGGDAATDGGLTKKGTGVLTLADANTYTGTTTIEAGTLKIAKATALYGGTVANWTAAKLNIRNGGLLAFNVGGTGELSSSDVTTLLANLSASTGLTNGMNAGASLGFDTTNATGGFTINDTLADTTGPGGGARGFQKFGSNTLTLAGTNSHSGGTTVHGGTLVIGNASAIGTGTLTVATTANTVIQAGTDLSGANALSNNIVLTANTRIDGTNNLELGGAITRNSVGLYKYGSGTLTLSGTGSGGTGDLECWAGALNVTGSWGTALSAGKITARGTGGVINWSGNGFAGSLYGLGAEGDGGQVNITGGSLSISSTGSAIFLGSTPATGSQISVSGGSVLVTSNGAVRIGAGGYNGATSNGPSTMTISGTGVLDTGTTTGVLAIGSGVSGNTVGTGTLNLNAGGTLATARTITSGSVANGTLNFNGGTFKANAATAGIGLDATLGRANVRNGGALINTNSFDITIAQALAHSNIGGDAAVDGGLTKAGSGTLTLTNTNTYTGTTTITGGTLALSGSGSIATSPSIIVGANATFDVSGVTGGYSLGSGQTLSGSGAVTGDLTVSGTLAPGNSPGELTFNDNLGLGGTLDLEVTGISSGLFDRLMGDGSNTLTLGGVLNLNNTGYSATLGDEITVFSGWGTISGSFTSITGTDLGGGLTWDTGSLATLGKLTVIPEPATAMLGGLGLLALLPRRRATKVASHRRSAEA